MHTAFICLLLSNCSSIDYILICPFLYPILSIYPAQPPITCHRPYAYPAPLMDWPYRPLFFVLCGYARYRRRRKRQGMDLSAGQRGTPDPCIGARIKGASRQRPPGKTEGVFIRMHLAAAYCRLPDARDRHRPGASVCDRAYYQERLRYRYTLPPGIKGRRWTHCIPDHRR